MAGWVAVDLDGTLVFFDPNGWKGPEHVGKPVPAMVARVKQWLAEGIEVRIFTARASIPEPELTPIREAIEAWCVKHLGQKIQITCTKDFGMIELWDDRAVRVRVNTGEPCCKG